MQILNAEQTKQALPFPELVKALEQGFQQDVHAPLRHHHFIENADQDNDVLLLMPAWSDKDWGGIKIVNVVPGNAQRSLPSISASYILFDRTTGEHVLLLDGAELTARRTAAASALAASKLARPDSRRLLIVGAGKVGSQLAVAYRAVLPIEEVLIYDRSFAKSEALAAELNSSGIVAKPAENLQSAVEDTDIVSCATLAREPVVLGEWLKPGQHVDLIGSFTPDMREVDDEAVRQSRIFIDTEHALVESGDLAIPLRDGVIKNDDICGTLIDLCRGTKPGRTSSDEITLFKGVGTAIEDLAAASLAKAELSNSS